jgi:hypothetical protein
MSSTEAARNDPSDKSTGRKNLIGHGAHQPNFTTAVDETKFGTCERLPCRARGIFIASMATWTGATEYANGIYADAAVAWIVCNIQKQFIDALQLSHRSCSGRLFRFAEA